MTAKLTQERVTPEVSVPATRSGMSTTQKRAGTSLTLQQLILHFLIRHEILALQLPRDHQIECVVRHLIRDIRAKLLRFGAGLRISPLSSPERGSHSVL